MGYVIISLVTIIVTNAERSKPFAAVQTLKKEDKKISRFLKSI